MLDREGVKRGIHDQGAQGLPVMHEILENRPVPLARIDDACDRRIR
jgi:hypothetical protein